jgi:DNA-binding CsgD family transcriptional regulator
VSTGEDDDPPQESNDDAVVEPGKIASPPSSPQRAEDHNPRDDSDQRTKDAIAALKRRSASQPGGLGHAALDGRVTLQSLLDLSRSNEVARTELVARITDQTQVIEALDVLLRTAREEVLNFQPGGPFDPAQLKQGMKDDLETMRHVTTKTIYSRAVGADQENFEILQTYASAGAEVRIAPMLPHRLVIFDRKCAVLPINADRVTSGALIVREPAMVLSLWSLFTTIWNMAKPLSLFRGSDTGPSEIDRNVLLLMSTGVTDEVASARLGVSLRTYRRHIASLLLKLEAQSRFQAGTKAVERGWI